MSRFYLLCLGFIVILLALAGLQYWLAEPLPPPRQPAAAIESSQATHSNSEHRADETVFKELARLTEEPATTIATSLDTVRPQSEDVEDEEIDFLKPINIEEISPELKETISTVYIEFYRGNYEYAAMVALGALELGNDDPRIQLIMHTSAGVSYEKIGYIDLAIEQYRQALAIFPEQATSYNSLRRLDPTFAASHPALEKPDANKATTNKAAANPKI